MPEICQNIFTTIIHTLTLTPPILTLTNTNYTNLILGVVAQYPAIGVEDFGF